MEVSSKTNGTSQNSKRLEDNGNNECVIVWESQPSFLTNESQTSEPVFIYQGWDGRKHPIYLPKLRCLAFGQWIDDMIIQFWLGMMSTERMAPEHRQKVYTFDTLFFTKLSEQVAKRGIDGKRVPSAIWHEEIKSFTNDVDIFAKDFLVIPINDQKHWCAVIVGYPGRVSSAAEKGDRPYITLVSTLSGESMDLCGICVNHVIPLIRQFLTIEYKKRKNADGDFRNNSLPKISAKIPFQPTLDDCGIFILHFLERFLQDPYVNFRTTGGAGMKFWFYGDNAQNVDLKEFVAWKRETIFNRLKQIAQSVCPDKVDSFPTYNFKASWGNFVEELDAAVEAEEKFFAEYERRMQVNEIY